MDIIWLTATLICLHRLANRIFGRLSFLRSLASLISGWCCGLLMHAAAGLIQLSLVQTGALNEAGGARLDAYASVSGVALGVLLARHHAKVKSAKAAEPSKPA